MVNLHSSGKQIILSAFFPLIFLALFNNTTAQEVISSSGDYQIKSNGSISYTIGEPVIETLKGTDVTITQGFQQSAFIITNIAEFSGLDFDVFAFPNPTDEFVILRIVKDNFTGIEYLLHDISGRLLMKQPLQQAETLIPFSNLAAGNYTLNIILNNFEIKSFKIVKIR